MMVHISDSGPEDAAQVAGLEWLHPMPHEPKQYKTCKKCERKIEIEEANGGSSG